MPLPGPSQTQGSRFRKLLPREAPIQEQPAQEGSHLPTGCLGIQDAVPPSAPPMSRAAHAGPSQELVPPQWPPHRVPLQEEPTQEGSHQELPAGYVGIQELVPQYDPLMFNAEHAGPSLEPSQWEPQAEQAAMGMSIPTWVPPIAEVTRAGEFQGVLPQDQPWEPVFGRFSH
jgi:hypothetical protein